MAVKDDKADGRILESFMIDVFRGWGVKELRNFSSVYRMMRDLVRKGLVGRVLKVRPTIWVDVNAEGELALDVIKTNAKLLGLALEGKLGYKLGTKSARIKYSFITYAFRM